jgi:hypothetical protein
MATTRQWVGENLMKTAVIEQDGIWWFKWCNVVAGLPVGQNDGPFATKEEAEDARRKFEDERKRKYPWEQILSE